MKVSVIIPCYNVEEYINECIESVLSQTEKDVEIICIDNGSTDKTSDMLSNFAEKHPGKITIDSESRKGAPFARNKGLELAMGEWIQFLDADDLLENDKIQHQLEIAANHPEVDFIA